MSRGLFTLAVGAVLLVQAAVALAGPTDAEKCEADKLKRAGKHAFCQMKAESKFVKTGDAAKLASDLAKCDTKIEAAFTKADAKYPTECPTLGDVGDIQTQVGGDTDDLGILLSGGTLPACGDGAANGDEQCDGVDLGGATCDSLVANTAGTLACTPECQYDFSGCFAALPSCGDGVLDAGEECDPGFGGDLNGETCASQAAGLPFGVLACTPGVCTFDTSGCVLRFEDTGLTVIDHLTDLEWVKTDDGGGLTDKDNSYTWTSVFFIPDGTAYTVYLAGLNGASFAGHNDWRLPTSAGCCGMPSGEPAELESIVDCSFGNPCIDPIFGPTASSPYWSSTTVLGALFDVAWWVGFNDGLVDGSFKTDSLRVRAVRGGS